MPASRKWTSADTSAAVDTFLAGLVHRTSEYFATTHLRAKEGIGVILHLGAKDRARVTFTGLDHVRARATTFQQVLRQWIGFVGSV
jgi:hypothetical protein